MLSNDGTSSEFADRVLGDHAHHAGDVTEHAVEIDDRRLAVVAAGDRHAQVGGEHRLAAAALRREHHDHSTARRLGFSAHRPDLGAALGGRPQRGDDVLVALARPDDVADP